MRAGKKKRGSRGNEFLPARSVWGGKRFRNSTLAEYQNRKIFISLIEKNFWSARLKNVKKIFLFCSPSGERKRWAGLSLAGRQLKVGVRILFKVGSNFVQKIPPFYYFGVLRRYCLALCEGSPATSFSDWRRGWDSNPQTPKGVHALQACALPIRRTPPFLI